MCQRVGTGAANGSPGYRAMDPLAGPLRGPIIKATRLPIFHQGITACVYMSSACI